MTRPSISPSLAEISDDEIKERKVGGTIFASEIERGGFLIFCPGSLKERIVEIFAHHLPFVSDVTPWASIYLHIKYPKVRSGRDE